VREGVSEERSLSQFPPIENSLTLQPLIKVASKKEEKFLFPNGSEIGNAQKAFQSYLTPFLIFKLFPLRRSSQWKQFNFYHFLSLLILF